MKKIFCLFSCLTVLTMFSLSVLATPNSTSTVTSGIYFSGGGTGYSDTYTANPTSLTIPYGDNEATIRYKRYSVTLQSFMFNYYPQNVKPGSDVLFNFRLTKISSNGSHIDCASVIHLTDIHRSTPTVYTDDAGINNGYGYSGSTMAMKSNVSNYSLSGCGLTCKWYLYSLQT